MRSVVQRVTRARVTVASETVGETGPGLVILLGVGAGDREEDAAYLAAKIANLRIFEDGQGKMNLSLLDVGGGALVVSQFTLLGDCRQGRRPGFFAAAPPEVAEKLYLKFVDNFRGLGIPVATGAFGAHMLVELINDGPVTMLLDSKREF
ncbi:MAG: D-aminoacyl-tRNA deacylase [Bacillota bacterium]